MSARTARKAGDLRFWADEIIGQPENSIKD